MNTPPGPSWGESSRCQACGAEVDITPAGPIPRTSCPYCGAPILSQCDTAMDHGPGGTGGVAVPSMWDAIGGEPAVGRVLLDRYRVLRKLGSNGGSIWLVRQ